MSITYSTSIVVVTQDPNAEGDLQGGQKQMLAMLDDGSKTWRFVTGNAAGLKWVRLDCAGSVNDPITTSYTGTLATMNASSNDEACDGVGVRTYVLLAGSETNVTVVDNTDGTFDYTPIADGAWSFIVQYFCDGVLTDTSVTSGVSEVQPVAADDIIATSASGTLGVIDVTTNDTASAGVTTYQLVGASETNVTTTNNNDGTFDYTPTTGGAWSFQVEMYNDGVATGIISTVSGVATNLNAYIMEFTTTGAGQTVALPLKSTDAAGIMTFSDGTPTIVGDPSGYSHTFATAGTHTIEFEGVVSNYEFATTTDDANKDYLTGILQWGTGGGTSASFRYADNITTIDPNLQASTTNLTRFLANSTSNPDLSSLDVSNVTNMFFMFFGNSAITPNTATWNTSSVNNMGGMFYLASLANPDTSKWDTSSVTRMSSMFQSANSAAPTTTYSVGTANGGGNAWDTSNVTNMQAMFKSTPLANPDTSGWDVSSVQQMDQMFRDTTVANPDTSGWDTSAANNMSFMFYFSDAANPDTSAWDTSNVTNMALMFSSALSANPVTTYVASGATAGGDAWNVSAVTSMQSMFSNTPLANPDTTNWNTSSVNRMDAMFASASVANPITTNWDTSSVTTISSMFSRTPVANPDVSNWDTSSVTNMNSVFSDTTLATPDISKWDVSSVTNMGSMFLQSAVANPTMVYSVGTANGGGNAWDTSNVTAMGRIFEQAPLLDQDISSWQFDSLTDILDIFHLSGITTANYDAFLIQMSAEAVTHGIVNEDLGTVPATYTNAVSGLSRGNLIALGWTISDLGGI